MFVFRICTIYFIRDTPNHKTILGNVDELQRERVKERERVQIRLVCEFTVNSL